MSSWAGADGKTAPSADLIESLEKPVRDRIVFKGYVDGDELSRLYRRARLFVLPSLHEGFCLPILEAMASGTAVLTAPRTAIPEVFGDAVEYADPLSPEDIAGKLYELVSDGRKRARLEKQGALSLKKIRRESYRLQGISHRSTAIAAALGNTARTR